MMLIASIAMACPTGAEAAGVAGIFGQGQVHFQVEAGNGYAFNNSYLILGVGLSYYVLDGLSVGLAYENWSGGGPGINKTTPSVQYVFYHASTVKPYIGAFYRHATVAGLPGINSAGGRAGIYIASGARSAVGVGYVYESYLNCQTAIYATCTESYPEVSITFGF